MSIHYLLVMSRSIVCPFLRQKTVGSGWPLGGPHSNRAVSPCATLVFFGSARKSSRRTVNRDVKDQVVFVVVLIHCITQLIHITDKGTLNTSDQTNAVTRYTPLCALALSEQMFVMWRAWYTKYRYSWQITPPLWTAGWLINKVNTLFIQKEIWCKTKRSLEFLRNHYPLWLFSIVNNSFEKECIVLTLIYIIVSVMDKWAGFGRSR